MKKIFQLLIVLTLLLSNIQLSLAALDRTCYDGCLELGGPDYEVTSADRRACRNECLTSNSTSSNSITPEIQAAVNTCINGCLQDLGIQASQATTSQINTCKNSPNCQGILNSETVVNELPDFGKPNSLPGPNISSNASGEDIQNYVTQRVLPKIANRLITIVTLISIFGLIFAGVKFITAFGSEEEIGKAKKTALYAVIGLVVALSSFLIVSIINNINL